YHVGGQLEGAVARLVAVDRAEVPGQGVVTELPVVVQRRPPGWRGVGADQVRASVDHVIEYVADLQLMTQGAPVGQVETRPRIQVDARGLHFALVAEAGQDLDD